MVLHGRPALSLMIKESITPWKRTVHKYGMTRKQVDACICMHARRDRGKALAELNEAGFA
jgi:hypothetical protein